MSKARGKRTPTRRTTKATGITRQARDPIVVMAQRIGRLATVEAGNSDMRIENSRAEIDALVDLISCTPARNLFGAAAQIRIAIGELDGLESPGVLLNVEATFAKVYRLLVSAFHHIEGKHNAHAVWHAWGNWYGTPAWPFPLKADFAQPERALVERPSEASEGAS